MKVVFRYASDPRGSRDRELPTPGPFVDFPGPIPRRGEHVAVGSDGALAEVVDVYHDYGTERGVVEVLLNWHWPEP